MRNDPRISKRFEELAAKATAVSKTRKSSVGINEYSVSYPLFHEWATSVLSLLERTFGNESFHSKNFSQKYQRFGGWEVDFENCHSIFKAAREDYEGGYLFDVRAMAKAEVLSDAIEQAKGLLAHNYKDPACVLCRVALETTLKELCNRKSIPHGKLDRMNAELSKAGVYNMAKQKQITAWAEIGNRAAHGEWDQYTENDARSMLDGVEALVADIL